MASRGFARRYSGGAQRFLRKIESPDAGVLVDVAQDVGQLEGAAEVMRQGDALRVLHFEYANA